MVMFGSCPITDITMLIMTCRRRILRASSSRSRTRSSPNGNPFSFLVRCEMFIGSPFDPLYLDDVGHRGVAPRLPPFCPNRARKQLPKGAHSGSYRSLLKKKMEEG